MAEVMEQKENNEQISDEGNDRIKEERAIEKNLEIRSRKKTKRKNLLYASIAIAAAGILVFSILLTHPMSGTVTLSSFEKISEGMSYDEVVKITGKESSSENITFDGSNAVLYTWPANLGSGNYTVSVICVDNKVVRIIQTTLRN